MNTNSNQNEIRLILEALLFASIAHKEQKRKYNNEPYINHCIDVAHILQSKTESDANMIAAAVLHDTVEDCGITLSEIENKFGKDVMQLVSDLTDVSKKSDGHRDIRKQMDLEHSAKTSRRAKTIKLADILSNLRNIVELNSSFASMYIFEKEKLLKVLGDSDSTLYQLALDKLNQSKKELKQKSNL